MAKKFKIIGNRRYFHNFEIGQIVELVQIYPDGVYELEGEIFGRVQKNDVHPIDAKEDENENLSHRNTSRL